MIYAREVMGLLGALPTRPFKMIEIRRYVETSVGATSRQRRESVRIGVGRVISSLLECGAVTKLKTEKRTLYQWTNSAT